MTSPTRSVSFIHSRLSAFSSFREKLHHPQIGSRQTTTATTVTNKQQQTSNNNRMKLATAANNNCIKQTTTANIRQQHPLATTPLHRYRSL